MTITLSEVRFIPDGVVCAGVVGPALTGGVVDVFVGVVGGMTVTLWLLQLSPIQHSTLQSSKVLLLGCALKAAVNVAHAASLSAKQKWKHDLIK